MAVLETSEKIKGGDVPEQSIISAVDDDAANTKKAEATVSAVNSEKDGETSRVDDDDFFDESIIVTGEDASRHLLSIRDDFDPTLTLRSLFLATILCCFQAVMNQIYMFKPTNVTISGTFIVLISYFLGKGWAYFLPRGDRLEARWQAQGGQGKLPLWLKTIKFINPGPWGLKEHSICAITAMSASEASASTEVFAAQKLFYDMHINATTVTLVIISIGLFGYGLAGLIRPITVWHVEAVYWGNLPTVKTLQGLHWQNVKESKPLRYFWYGYGTMFVYEWLPSYVWPWLNSVSIPCLASMKATGTTGETLTNIFGGSTSNEGLGLFSISLDWQYITSSSASNPLKLLVHSTLGVGICFVAMAVVYWGNIWDSRNLPFMSTSLRTASGKKYPSASVFVNGILDENALAEHGTPRLAGSFAWALLMSNGAIGALIMHVILFWGKQIIEQYKSAMKGKFDCRHHEHMAKHYKEVPWIWYSVVLVLSFVLGLIVVIKEDIMLPAWAYVAALALGIIIAPISCVLYSRFGNGIATNNLSKMLAGLLLPGRPVGNMYFAAYSHNVISTCVDLCQVLKMGEYLKISPRVMFLTQAYGTILGGFINYAVMDSIVASHKDLLTSGNGNANWSGAILQSYNTKATSWALAKYMYKAGTQYALIPWGLAIGALLVVIHRVAYHFFPRARIGNINIIELNLPQLISYSGDVPSGGMQTCTILSSILVGFFSQFYLRNYKPRIFRDYMYLVTGAWDGAALTVQFILSFALLGAGGPTHLMAKWWGNNVDGNLDLCPDS